LSRVPDVRVVCWERKPRGHTPSAADSHRVEGSVGANAELSLPGPGLELPDRGRPARLRPREADGDRSAAPSRSDTPDGLVAETTGDVERVRGSTERLGQRLLCRELLRIRFAAGRSAERHQRGHDCGYDERQGERRPHEQAPPPSSGSSTKECGIRRLNRPDQPIVGQLVPACAGTPLGADDAAPLELVDRLVRELRRSGGCPVDRTPVPPAVISVVSIQRRSRASLTPERTTAARTPSAYSWRSTSSTSPKAAGARA
jgi:hypothetical protein